ncbi:MAG: hypothetical protein AABX33_06980 [Nanoarchaeota archaeon]
MKSSAHFLSSLILAGILYPILNWKVLIILVGGVLIDIDHYFWYVYKYHEINFFKSYFFYLEKMNARNFTDVNGILLIFHTGEFLLPMIILSFYSEWASMFTIGLLLHHFMDLIYLYTVPKRFVVNHSVVYWIFKNKIQKI